MKLIGGLTLLVSRKDPNILNQISLKPIMDMAIMQIFYDMHDPKMPSLPLAQPIHPKNLSLGHRCCRPVHSQQSCCI
jgi:hypothetical protein